ncbi:3-phosphonopyruvate decarboxylase [Cohnella kolymensis]|uniref:3-phosphonopyruvate decarboxylase n=1 Tax=Cohnella kolymensis TaxID=1590652 RepID=A0ABR5A5J2_9BACL|nr:phosphonopyruvate decarboxylase [Cohnella kolymensis]KIL35712.1 3-phosphonopyruvate decarboxylase [Cohnella kolymensis]
MLNTKSFGRELKKMGFDFYSGVPCSFLKNLINYAINECEYIGATNEGDAVAIAAGALLGGKKPVVLMQNSGLSNAVSPLVSLNYPFRMPVLGFVSWRGQPGYPDEPQHELMGRITTKLLDSMQVKWMYLSNDMEKAKRQLVLASQYIESGHPFFFVVKKGTFAQEILEKQERSFSVNKVSVAEHADDQLPSRQEALRVINRWKDAKTVQLATTGKTGRQLYEIEDASNNLYMVGSMGCVGSFGLGLALSKPDFDIVVIDGDGALLMRMGSLATSGYYNPENMIHILLDNNAHDSTGGQMTVSHNIHFVNIASSCGYSKSIYIHNLDELNTCLEEWKMTKGLTFVHLKISSSTEDELGRPAMKPHEVKERLEIFLNRNFSEFEGVGS